MICVLPRGEVVVILGEGIVGETAEYFEGECEAEGRTEGESSVTVGKKGDEWEADIGVEPV